ncbi:MAG: sulfatase-like hydrolase/transferase [Chloroflexi bacterium]|nr:sulfatase-like hydrolase/transferase [Chloroflexota bacterium]
MGCAGNPEIRTPNLDRMAERGTRFASFFCASPVCSPARASLLTGRIPSSHGVHDWIRAGNSNLHDDTPIEYLAGLSAYTDVLAANGYTCGLSGKWHLGSSNTPQKSFSHWLTIQAGAGPFYDPEMIRGDGTTFGAKGYISTLIADDALAFIDGQMGSDEPFYSSIHFTAPHSPWLDQHPEEIVASYDDCSFESCPQEPKHPGAYDSNFGISYMFSKRKHQPYEEIPPREYLKGYFAAVTAMDAEIGRIIGRLEETGLLESTLVVYLSDNGFNCGHHGIWGKGNTFPMNMYDTSVKVPAIWMQPGRVPAGVVCDELVSGYDVRPTLLDWVGLSDPDAAGLPGASFAGLLAGEPADDSGDRESIVVFDEYGPVRMIRSKTWKYVHRYPYGPHELFDLQEDPDERRNLYDEPGSGQVVAPMKARLDEWFVRWADPRRDGSREPVSSRGQVNLVGPGGKGQTAFHPLETVPSWGTGMGHTAEKDS